MTIKQKVERMLVRFFARIGDFILGLVMYILNTLHRTWIRLNNYFSPSDPDEILLEKLRKADNYKDWVEIATELDTIHGNHVWKKSQVTGLYDYKLIYSRLQGLRHARGTGDISTMTYLLRSGLLRNLGGINDPKLFMRSYLGTKDLVEDHLAETIRQLRYLGEYDSPEFPIQQKLEFFNDTRQAFGNTALLLQGGATFGLYHLGVVKALHKQQLLPRIISGTSVGALIAALVCVRQDDQLDEIFEPNGINLSAFATKSGPGNISRKITRLLKHGYLLDVTVIEQCVKSNLGDITFEDAFKRTNRILNITINSSRKNEPPRLLNYLTAPNVLIRTAACASVAQAGLYKPVDLMAKEKGKDVPFSWNPPSSKWKRKISQDNDAPEARLGELFNVNHFIVSQASPYIVPFLSTWPIKRRSNILEMLMQFVTSEIRHRVNQLGRLGLMPSSIQNLFGQKTMGHITIAPPLSSADFYTIFSNPTHASLNYWILKGEQSTWPFLSWVRHRTSVELTLFKVHGEIKQRVEAAMRTVSGLPPGALKRTKSIA